MDTLHDLAAQNPRWSLEDFAEVVNRLLPAHLPEEKANTRVREEVNPRLIRQYTTIGLVDPPLKEGREARYTHRHLLQILVARRLMAQGYGTSIIIKQTGGHTDAQLLALLTGDSPLPVVLEAPNPALDFLKNLGAPAPSGPPPGSPLFGSAAGRPSPSKKSMPPPAPPASPKSSFAAPSPAARRSELPAPAPPPAYSPPPPGPPQDYWPVPDHELPEEAFADTSFFKEFAHHDESAEREKLTFSEQVASEQLAYSEELAPATADELYEESIPDTHDELYEEPVPQGPAPLPEAALRAAAAHNFSHFTAPAEPERPSTHTWTRHDVAPGLEVHVRDDFPLPTSPDTQAALLDAIRRQVLPPPDH